MERCFTHLWDQFQELLEPQVRDDQPLQLLPVKSGQRTEAPHGGNILCGGTGSRQERAYMVQVWAMWNVVGGMVVVRDEQNGHRR